MTEFRPSPRLWRNLGLSLLLGVVVFAVAALYADLRALLAAISRFDWLLALPILALTALNLALRYAKWELYLRWLGVRLRAPESIAIFLSNFLLILTPGKMGGLLKSYFVRQVSGVPMAHTMPIVLVERLTDGIGMILMTTLALLVYPPAWPVVALVVAALAAVIVGVQLRPLVLWGLALAERWLGERVAPLRDFYQSSYQLLRWRPLVTGVVLGTLSRATEGVALFTVLLGLGQASSVALFGDAIFIAALSNVIGVVVMLPGGLGGTEGSLTSLLTLVVGLARGPATAATLLLRVATFWVPALLGGVALLWKRRVFFAVPPENESVPTDPLEVSYDRAL